MLHDVIVMGRDHTKSSTYSAGVVLSLPRRPGVPVWGLMRSIADAIQCIVRGMYITLQLRKRPSLLEMRPSTGET